MIASQCCRSACAAVALLAWSRGAGADTRAELTALLDSGNLLGSAASSADAEPPPWEGLASLRSGRDNRARLALAAADPGLLPTLTTSALLRVEVGLDRAGQGEAPLLRDASSSVAIAWQAVPSTALTLRAFPFDTDSLRLGYLHALDWGGSDVGRHESSFVAQTGGVPGAELALGTRSLRLFSAVKWARVDDALRGPQRLWGTLSGGSFELTRLLRLDAGFGYFERAASSATETRGFVEGASVRLVWHRAVSEPELAAEPFRPPSFHEDPERLAAGSAQGFALAVEAVTLVSRRQRFENPGAEQLSAAPAAAIYGSLRGRRLAWHAALTWRSLPFVLRNNPRALPDESLPVQSVQRAELAAWLGASLDSTLGLVPSVEVGARLPGALEMQSSLPGFAQTFVASAASGLRALPVGAQRLPALATRLGVRFQASVSVALVGFVEYQRDPNRTRLDASPTGVTRGFDSPDSLSLQSGLTARF